MSYSEKDCQVILTMGREDYLDLIGWSGEAVNKLPADVQGVLADFEKDYLNAVTNFKEAYVSMLEWATRARDELQMMRGYLEAEKVRDELGLNSGNPDYTPYRTGEKR